VKRNGEEKSIIDILFDHYISGSAQIAKTEGRATQNKKCGGNINGAILNKLTNLEKKIEKYTSSVSKLEKGISRKVDVYEKRCLKVEQRQESMKKTVKRISKDASHDNAKRAKL
jgi:hypothetical protein